MRLHTEAVKSLFHPQTCGLVLYSEHKNVGYSGPQREVYGNRVGKPLEAALNSQGTPTLENNGIIARKHAEKQ